MFVVDTNVLLYAVNTSAPEHPRCRELLAAWCAQRSPWYVTWNILYEFLRAATHRAIPHRPLSTAAAVHFVDTLLRVPSLGVLDHSERHRGILSELVAADPSLVGNIMHDVHTAVLMRENGISTIYTRDADFRRFPFLTVIDPLAAGD